MVVGSCDMKVANQSSGGTARVCSQENYEPSPPSGPTSGFSETMFVFRQVGIVSSLSQPRAYDGHFHMQFSCSHPRRVRGHSTVNPQCCSIAKKTRPLHDALSITILGRYPFPAFPCEIRDTNCMLVSLVCSLLHSGD